MKKPLMFAVLAGASLASIATAEDHHGQTGHQHSSSSYETGAEAKAAETTGQQLASADGKRLPGRDCKLYEGGTRQHTFPQYEIGNPNRPECPSENK